MTEKVKTRAKLKPCPFCGKSPEIFVWHKDDPNVHNIYSIACKCGCESPKNSVSIQGAKKIWNRRRYPAQQNNAPDNKICDECERQMNVMYTCDFCGVYETISVI